MERVYTIALTVVFTILFLVLYKFVVNPQVVAKLDPIKMSLCPDGWTFNGALCSPDHSTHCTPFDPTASSLQTVAARCALAVSCGTTWNGMCG